MPVFPYPRKYGFLEVLQPVFPYFLKYGRGARISRIPYMTTQLYILRMYTPREVIYPLGDLLINHLLFRIISGVSKRNKLSQK